MYEYVNDDRDRIGKLTISEYGDVRYNGKLDIASSAALHSEMFPKMTKFFKQS